MLLQKRVYYKGAWNICTRYISGDFTRMKDFFSEFEPIWFRNNRDLSHITDRLAVLRSGGGASTMSGLVAKRFMAAAAQSYDFNLITNTIGEIMTLAMSDTMETVKDRFSRLVLDLAGLVRADPIQLINLEFSLSPSHARTSPKQPYPSLQVVSFYQFCQLEGVERRISGKSASYVLHKSALPKPAMQSGTVLRDAVMDEAIEQEIADSFMFLEDKEEYYRAEIENTERLRKKYGLPPRAAPRAIPIQGGESVAAVPTSGNVGSGHSSDLYTVYIAERGPDGNVVGSFIVNSVSASAIAWRRLKELHHMIWPKVAVADPSYRKIADVLARFDPSPSLQGAIRMPYKADSTWTAYAPSTFAPPIEGEDGLETIFSVDALCEKEGTMTFGVRWGFRGSTSRVSEVD
jgi:hypothetical protein